MKPNEISAMKTKEANVTMESPKPEELEWLAAQRERMATLSSERLRTDATTQSAACTNTDTALEAYWSNQATREWIIKQRQDMANLCSERLRANALALNVTPFSNEATNGNLNPWSRQPEIRDDGSPLIKLEGIREFNKYQNTEQPGNEPIKEGGTETKSI